MTTALAASTVLALAGSSHGFIVNQFAIQPGANIAPNVGSFHQELGYYGSYAVGNLISGAAGDWKGYRSSIEGSTWLAADRKGGGGDYTTADGLAGERPEWNGTTANALGGAAPLIQASPAAFPSIEGGGAGYTWGANDTTNFEATSAVSLVNGVSVDSIFFGNFVFDDAGATGLVGQDLLVTIGGVNNFLPLDGSKGSGGFAIEYEPFVGANGKNGLKGFVVVPTPGAAGLLGIAGLAAIRRRR